jgi:hypothetical protein
MVVGTGLLHSKANQSHRADRHADRGAFHATERGRT